jgi:hypothetical protein
VIDGVAAPSDDPDVAAGQQKPTLRLGSEVSGYPDKAARSNPLSSSGESGANWAAPGPSKQLCVLTRDYRFAHLIFVAGASKVFCHSSLILLM